MKHLVKNEVSKMKNEECRMKNEYYLNLNIFFIRSEATILHSSFYMCILYI
jgi:hypothetical protein